MAGPHRDDVNDPTLVATPSESAARETAVEGPNRTRRPTMDLVKRGSSIGRYVVIDQLGQGGMGIVYSAYDPELDRRVALKLVHPGPEGSGSTKGGATRIQREAQALARLSHPNVVAIFDVGTI